MAVIANRCPALHMHNHSPFQPGRLKYFMSVAPFPGGFPSPGLSSANNLCMTVASCLPFSGPQLVHLQMKEILGELPGDRSEASVRNTVFLCFLNFDLFQITLFNLIETSK